MNETRKMRMEVRILTLLLRTTSCTVCIILFPGAWERDITDILIGSLTGIMGFNMVQNMAGHIDGEPVDIKSRAFYSYMQRYVLHTVIFALSVIAGAHIVALLVGILFRKYSILIYSWKHRKGDEQWTISLTKSF